MGGMGCDPREGPALANSVILVQGTASDFSPLYKG